MTERKRSEEALREAEARLALEAARMGEWRLDLVTGEATHSALYDRIFGYEEPLSAWTFETFSGHVHPDDRAFVTEAFGRSRQTGEDWAFECRIERADGEARWIWALGSVRRDVAPGDGGRMYGLVTDITERKRAERAVRASEAKYRTLFNSTDEGFCLLEVLFDAGERPFDYRFHEVNPPFERQSGLEGAAEKTILERQSDGARFRPLRLSFRRIGREASRRCFQQHHRAQTPRSESRFSRRDLRRFFVPRFRRRADEVHRQAAGEAPAARRLQLRRRGRRARIGHGQI